MWSLLLEYAEVILSACLLLATIFYTVINYLMLKENRGIPIIGDCVYIGPEVKVIGKIIVGNNVAIGANAIVTKMCLIMQSLMEFLQRLYQ